ncbi:MAG: inositol monophosphatase [Opitutae bacterium]|nr:inositol monophosphatase [Opitutae bacterium]
MNLKELTTHAVQAAREAGELIRSYQDREVEVLHKEGGDTYASQVVTEVDRKAQDAILQILGPPCEEFDLAVLTEESEDDGSRFEKKFFWCIDPMDGTLPFIRKEPGYSVSIGLVAKDGSPRIGVVYDPVHDVLWQATKGQGVQRNGELWTLDASSQELTFTYDRSFVDRPERDRVLQTLEDYAHSIGLGKLVPTQFGGAVINACHALENSPGCHFKFSKPQEGGGSLWDYAATACLYEEAGAVVSDVHGDPLDLNRPDSTFMNHRGAVYATDQGLAERIREILVPLE